MSPDCDERFGRHGNTHHDNVHTTFLVISYPTEPRVPMIPQWPYNPGMSPFDFFFLFPCLERPTKRRRRVATGGFQEACTAALKTIPEKTYHLTLGNHAGRDISIREEGIWKLFSAFY